MTKLDIAREYLIAYPSIKNKTELARIMFNERPDAFKDIESARHIIRDVVGCNGKNRRGAIRDKSLFSLNKNFEQDLSKKILFIDIETAPSKGYYWSRYNNNVSQNQVISEGYILCYAYKWLGEPVQSDSLPKYKYLYSKDHENDYELVYSIRELLNQAEVVIAHNGDKFDRKKINTRLVFHDMQPILPYRSVDTLKIARGMFKFPSNRLDDLGAYLGLGRKIDTGGFELWVKCMDGNQEAWNNMVTYCENDVELLERVYLKLRTWDKKHPNMGVYYDDGKMHCTVCGSTDLERSERVYTNSSAFSGWVCKNCGHHNRDRINSLSKDTRKNLLMNPQ